VAVARGSHVTVPGTPQDIVVQNGAVAGSPKAIATQIRCGVALMQLGAVVEATQLGVFVVEMYIQS
jgi:hypothetical protein